jgi:hypothetical protein
MILISRFHETGERIKMKLLKKTLVATALVTAFGAQAVKVSSDKVQISKEGTDFGLKALVATDNATGDDFVLDFVIGEFTPSGSYITLTFGDNVGLSDVNSSSSAIDNVIGSGEGLADVDVGNAVFSYGTGSFTFDKFLIEKNDDDQDTIEFEVNLGNAIPAGSAFRLTLSNFGPGGVELAGAGEVCYESREDEAKDSAVIESGCSTISEVASQFSFLVTQEFDGKIERVAQDSFARKSDNGVDTQDTVKFKLSNDETLAAALNVANAAVVFEGNFKAVTDGEVASANIGATALATQPVATDDDITFELTGAEITNAGVEVEVVTDFDANASGTAITIPQTGDIDATVTFFDTTSVAGTTTGTEVSLDVADAGSWSLDATVINVPYLPLGFDETSSSVHIANDGNASANVIATIVTFCDAFAEDSTCIDQTRSESVELGDVPANTVAKIKQGALMTAFGITDPTKVSVTLNIDADAEDISAYATVQNSTGRTEVSNSQAKVDGK